MTVPQTRIARWPVMLIAAPAGVATWSGWVELGRMTGFGKVQLLPGIWDSIQLDTAITLPVGVEAYAMYAMYAALAPASLSTGTRRFAGWSAAGALGLGMAGQVAYHLLHAAGRTSAPWQITTLVSCLPVLVLGMAGLLAHAVRRDAGHADTREETGPADMSGADIGRADTRTPGRPDMSPADTTGEDMSPADIGPVADMETDTRTPGHPDVEADMTGADTESGADMSGADVRADMTGEDIVSGADIEPDMETDVRVSGADTQLTPVTELPGRDALARQLLDAEPDMSGAELGRRMGLSDRQGRRLADRVRGAA